MDDVVITTIATAGSQLATLAAKGTAIQIGADVLREASE